MYFAIEDEAPAQTRGVVDDEQQDDHEQHLEGLPDGTHVGLHGARDLDAGVEDMRREEREGAVDAGVRETLDPEHHIRVLGIPHAPQAGVGGDHRLRTASLAPERSTTGQQV